MKSGDYPRRRNRHMATIRTVLELRLEDFFDETGLDAGDERKGVKEIVDKIFEMRGISNEKQKEEW
jgi:hypothetical protein